MGYTHHRTFRGEAEGAVRSRLEAVAQGLRALLPHLPPLAGPWGRRKPTLGPSGIALNGPRPKGHQGFIFPRDGPIPGEG